jgi:hypothetical protein
LSRDSTKPNGDLLHWFKGNRTNRIIGFLLLKLGLFSQTRVLTFKTRVVTSQTVFLLLKLGFLLPKEPKIGDESF